jgi:hypothetical protein
MLDAATPLVAHGTWLSWLLSRGHPPCSKAFSCSLRGRLGSKKEKKLKNCFEVGSDLGVRNWKLVLSQNHFKIGSKLGVRNRNVVQKVWHGKKR